MQIKALLGAAAVAAVAAGAARSDVSYTCAEVDGLILLGSIAFNMGDAAPSLVLTGASSYWVELGAGDVLGVVARTGTPYTVEAIGGGGSLLSSLPMSLGIDPAGDWPAGLYWIGGLKGGDPETARAGGAAVSASGELLTATITCTPGATEEDGEGDETIAATSALNQNTSILNGLRGVRGRTTGGDVEVTRGTILGYSGDGASGWRTWAFTDFRRYSEAATGSSVAVTLGVDHDFGAARAGVLLSYDRTTLDAGGGDESVKALAIGPYITGGNDRMTYDAFVTYARPEYDLVSGSGTGERLAYGLAGEGLFDLGATQLAPFVTVNGAIEEFSGETLRTQSLAAGLRVNFGSIGAIDPYVSLAYQKTMQDSSISGLTEHSAPRYGMGFEAEMAHGAIIGLDIDAGESLENLRDIGLRLSYTLEF